jgi:hypothetical protein
VDDGPHPETQGLAGVRVPSSSGRTLFGKIPETTPFVIGVQATTINQKDA